MELIEKNNEVIRKLCRNFNVSDLYYFKPPSDDEIILDETKILLVSFEDIPPEIYADNYYALKFALRDLLKSRIRLLEDQALKNPFFKKYINSNKKRIYGRQDKGLAV
jgi:hypothetical protein